MSPGRARGELARLVHRGLGVRDFSLAVGRTLRQMVPYEAFCVVTLDPATLLPTDEVVENGLPAAALARFTEIELRESDYNKFAALARAARPVASLSEATGEKLDNSRRHRELRRPNGFGDELRAVLVSETEVWGALTLSRERGRPHFTPTEVRRVASLAGHLAEGLRRAQFVGELAVGDGTAVGLILLAEDNSIERASNAARQLLDELAPHGADDGHAPTVVRAVADRVRGIAAGEGPAHAIARARVRTRAGRWLVAHGSLLDEGPAPQVAVILEPARAPELAPLIAAADGLTDREQKVTQLVARGLSTNAIADRLFLSPWTVQDHLKAIFSKTGTGTRGELVARLFLEHPGIWDGSAGAPPHAGSP